MRSRRAPPKVEGKSGRGKFAHAASAAGTYDGENDFPLDDLPPDDLPVRDITEDQTEQHPGHIAAIIAANQARRDLADPVHEQNADSPEPVNLRSGGDHLTLSAALLHEPVVETFCRTRSPSLMLRSRRPSTFFLNFCRMTSLRRDLTAVAEPTPCILVDHEAPRGRARSRQPRSNFGRITTMPWGTPALARVGRR